jgi:hypothetical protein
MSDLKPCPLCGGEAADDIYGSQDSSLLVLCVRCVDSGCGAAIISLDVHEEQGALAKRWNSLPRREEATAKPSPEQIVGPSNIRNHFLGKCPECNVLYGDFHAACCRAIERFGLVPDTEATSSDTIRSGE